MYWVYPEKNVVQYNEVKIQNPCRNEYKKYCLNGVVLSNWRLSTWRRYCRLQLYLVFQGKTLWKKYVVDLGETLK